MIQTSLTLDALLVEAKAHHQGRRLREAERLYRLILEAQPDHADALHLLGLLANDREAKDLAAELIGRAIAVNGTAAVYHLSLALVLRRQGKLDEAAGCYERALALEPDHTGILAALAGVRHEQGRLEEAARCYERALAFGGEVPDLLQGFANLLVDQGELEAAVTRYERALAMAPEDWQCRSNLGVALAAMERFHDAVAQYRRALVLQPDAPDVLCNLGNALRAMGRLDEAIACYQRALGVRPRFAEALSNLGSALSSKGRIEEAADCFERALAIDAGLASAHINRGNLLRDQGRLAEAMAGYQKALASRPDSVDALANLGNALLEDGRLEEAALRYEQALALKPGDRNAGSNLLFVRALQRDFAPEDYLALARRWEIACMPVAARAPAPSAACRPLAGRRLRVGYVSGDFRLHAVSYFVEQVFRHHDRQRIELFAYPTSARYDHVTARLQTLADRWVPLVGLSDAAACARIRADEIDVLVDLSGHTADNRLGVFALRAAPAQAHYLGYFASTGLSQMDYWIGDAVLTSPETDGQFREIVWRLPRVWVGYDAKGEAPAPGWRPDPGGGLWLGSFNKLLKLTPETLVLWARVLQALPEAQLLLKTRALADADNRRRLLGRFADHGIEASRIALSDHRATPDWRHHMAAYDRLDIALDPLGGVGGGTTTCDALWMGVPVITMCGDRMATRMTASMLHAIGRPEWVARNEQEYVEKVVSLARDVEQRRALRAAQRARMAASPLCDATGLARALEDAFGAMAEGGHAHAG
jgi:protein O-GlcNAc transferase